MLSDVELLSLFVSELFSAPFPLSELLSPLLSDPFSDPDVFSDEDSELAEGSLSLAPPLDFGIGYRHRGHDSNLMLATRKAALGQPTPQAIQVPRPPRELAAEEPTGAVPALRR